MKKQVTRFTALVLAFAMVLFITTSMPVEAAKKVSLSKKSITMNVNKTTTLKVKNNSKKVSWKVIKGSKNIKLSKKNKKECEDKGYKSRFCHCAGEDRKEKI